MKLFLSIYWDSTNISWYKWRYDFNTANKLPLELSLECIFQKEKKRDIDLRMHFLEQW